MHPSRLPIGGTHVCYMLVLPCMIHQQILSDLPIPGRLNWLISRPLLAASAMLRSPDPRLAETPGTWMRRPINLDRAIQHRWFRTMEWQIVMYGIITIRNRWQRLRAPLLIRLPIPVSRGMVMAAGLLVIAPAIQELLQALNVIT